MSLAYSPENRQAVTGHTAKANMWRQGRAIHTMCPEGALGTRGQHRRWLGDRRTVFLVCVNDERIRTRPRAGGTCVNCRLRTNLGKVLWDFKLNDVVGWV